MVTNNYWRAWVEQHPPLQREFLGNQLWQYGLFFLYVLAAVGLAKLADVVFSKYLTRLAARTRTQWDDRMIRLMHGPVRLVVFIFFMHLGVGVMKAEEWVQVYIRRGFGVLVGVVVTYLLCRMVDTAHELVCDRFARKEQRQNFQVLIVLRKTLKVFIIASAVLVTADNVGIKVTGVLASLGVTGLAVALASQEALANLLGSIIILADRPFFVGDRIKIGPDEGVVEHIGIRSTRLRTNEGDVITVPNRSFTTTSVRNYSRSSAELTRQPPA